jgi:hypothetical protein
VTMSTQESPLDMEAAPPQLSKTNSFDHAVALLVLSGRMCETLLDITDRVCARHFGATHECHHECPADIRPPNDNVEAWVFL